jgi:hypothetical protein
MNKVVARVDDAGYTASLCDHPAWAVQRLSLPLEFFHAWTGEGAGKKPPEGGLPHESAAALT